MLAPVASRPIDIADALIATPFAPARGRGGVQGAVANVGTNTVAHLGGELAVRHTGTSGANYTALGSPVPAVANCWVLVVRFRVDALGVTTTIANTSNQTTASNAYVLHLRVSTTGALQFVARDSATRFTTPAGTIQAGRWYTCAVRMGRFPTEQTGNVSMRGWLDGAQVGTFNNSSSSGLEQTGEVAVAGGKHLSATDGQNCAVSLAMFLPKSAPDDVCAALSADPWALLYPDDVPTFYSAGGGGTTYDVSISESVSASDSLSAAAAFGGALAEAVSASDVLAAVAALAGNLSEAASASDVVSAAAAYADALSEAASASESASAFSVRSAELSEAASASDAVSSTAQMAGALSESVSAADSIDGSIGAATYAAELVESVSASDSLTAAAVYASAIVEAVTAQDAVTASAVLGAVLDEVASASDSVGAALVLAAAISEAVSATDGWSGSVGSQVFEVELAEAASASDAWGALGVLARHGVRGAKAVQTQMSTRANVQTARRYN